MTLDFSFRRVRPPVQAYACSHPSRSETGSRLAKTVSRADGYASRIQGVVLPGDATKVRDALVGIFHSRPPMSPHVVFPAASDSPSAVHGMKVGCKVTGLRQAGKAEFGFVNRLKPAPVAHGAHQTALTDKELVLGSYLVSA